MKNKIYDNIIKNIGFVLAAVGSLVYIVTLFIMVVGISNEERNLTETLLYTAASAVLGIFMSIALGIQGEQNAKEEYKDLRREYLNKPIKGKKLHSMGFIWTTKIISWIFTKGLTTAAICASTLYLMIEGSRDWVLLFSGIGGCAMAFGFGFIAMDELYNKYIENVVPMMRKALEQRKIEDKEKQLGGEPVFDENGGIKDDCLE